MTERSQRPPQMRRKSARPSEIKTAALQVFAERGFEGASVDEIAQRAGLVKGSIYRYYLNKEDLFRAAVNPTGIEWEQGPENDELADRLISTISALSDPDASSVMRLLLIESRVFPDLTALWFEKVFAPAAESLADLIRERQIEGDIKDGDPYHQSFSILAPIILMPLFISFFDGTSKRLPNLETLAKNHIRIIMDGLRKSGTQI